MASPSRSRSRPPRHDLVTRIHADALETPTILLGQLNDTDSGVGSIPYPACPTASIVGRSAVNFRNHYTEVKPDRCSESRIQRKHLVECKDN